MAITPQTEVYLLKCPIEADNRNQINFASASAQESYFKSLPKIALDNNFTYQRKDNVIRVPEHIDTILQYNYVMYKNDNYSDKWFYAFITGMEYSSDHMTYVSIATDVYQTWQFQMNWKQSYVEREHVNDDTVGANTYPEALEYGHFICNDFYSFNYATPDDNSTMLVFQVTTTVPNEKYPANWFPSSDSRFYNGIPQGCYCFGFPATEANMGLLNTVIGAYDGGGRGDAINSIFLIPKECVYWETKNGGGTFESQTYYVPKSSTGSKGGSTLLPTFNHGSTLDGYTPKNGKLLTSPYNYLYVSNNAGSDVTYRYEDFDGDAEFRYSGVFEIGGSMCVRPANSNISSTATSGDGYNEAIYFGKLPTLSWTSDYYLNWQAINGKNVEVQTVLDSINFAGNALTSAISAGTSSSKTGLDVGGTASSMLGNVTNFASNVASTQQQLREAEMTPPQAKGNTTNGDFNFSAGNAKISFRRMSIKAEYAKKIDNFFSMFGYKVNTMKYPNITGRKNWNYVKTIGANIEGNIPQDDMNQLKVLFDSGITIWHNTATYLDYSQSNPIV